MRKHLGSLLVIVSLGCSDEDSDPPATGQGGCAASCTAGTGGIAGAGGASAGQAGAHAGKSGGGTAASAGNSPAGKGGNGGQTGGSGGQAGGSGQAGTQHAGTGNQAGTGGGGGAGSGGASTSGKQYKAQCLQSHGLVGCCEGETLHYQRWGSTTAFLAVDCALKGLACGWNGESYACVKAPVDDPAGTFPRACIEPPPEETCADFCFGNADCKLPYLPFCDPDQRCVSCAKDEDCKDPTQGCHAGRCVLKCQSDDVCLPFGAVCDPESLNCVDCLGDKDCSAFCDTKAKTCGGCQTDAQCGSSDFGCRDEQCVSLCTSNLDCKFNPAGHLCMPDGQCGECFTDKDCEKTGKPFCSPYGPQCLLCRFDSDCKEPAHRCGGDYCYFFCEQDTDCQDPLFPFCNTFSGECRECRQDKDCKDPAKPFCPEGVCDACTKDEHCPQPGECVGGYCQSTCKNDQECTDPTHPVCLVTLKSCQECNVDADCVKGNPTRPYCDGQHTCNACRTTFDCAGKGSCLDYNGYGECGSPEECFNSLYEADPTYPLDPQYYSTTFPAAQSTAFVEGKTCVGPGRFAWYSFGANEGDEVQIELFWQDVGNGRSYRMTAFDEAGHPLGETAWSNPQTLVLRFLPAGLYALRVQAIQNVDDPNVFPFKLGFKRSSLPCSSDELCRADVDNQRPRLHCAPSGSCQFVSEVKTLGQGQLCDHSDACAPGLMCAADTNLSVTDVAHRSICTVTCKTDADCPAPLLCHPTAGVSALCLPPCQQGSQCSVIPYEMPADPMDGWYRLACQQGHCQFP